MRRIRAVCGVVGVLAPHALWSQGSVQSAGWLAGCWEMTRGTTVIHEQWMAPNGGLMMGMSRTVVRDSAREYEQLRIERRATGVAYVAFPSGQVETAFPATALTDSTLVFNNPTHDFPQQISYRRVSKDSVIARIEGLNQGKPQAINFPMRRARCGGEGVLDAHYQLGFGMSESWDATVTRREPNVAFEWTMDASDDDWQGTRVGFTLSPISTGTRAEFAHRGWRDANAHFRGSSYCWATYLRILKRSLEHGEVVPYDRRDYA